ncbi:hypothetical protein D3C86_1871860 [compost metagenome]
MHRCDQLETQGFITLLPGEVHHLVIADHHALIRRTRQALALEHVLGHPRGGCRAFKLAAADGFVFNQIVEQITEVRVLTDLAGHVFQRGSRRLSVDDGHRLLRQWRQHTLAPLDRLAQGQKA